jgi:hypothetical protein
VNLKRGIAEVGHQLGCSHADDWAAFQRLRRLDDWRRRDRLGLSLRGGTTGHSQSDRESKAAHLRTMPVGAQGRKVASGEARRYPPRSCSQPDPELSWQIPASTSSPSAMPSSM